MQTVYILQPCVKELQGLFLWIIRPTVDSQYTEEWEILKFISFNKFLPIPRHLYPDFTF